MKEILKKFLTVFLIAGFASLLAGIYGILHDQITYSISPEYYTRFKFIQFNLSEEYYSIREKVAIVGFSATWWFGLFLGLILGIFGLRHKDWKTMFKMSVFSIFIAILITLIVGIMGFLYGNVVLSNQPKSEFPNWFIPHDLIDFKSFIAVGSMHNFSYIGGIISLIFGVVYSHKKASITAR
ncbi:hypothetical protein MUU74_01355 [Chryseobacterium daecheongense]|uniref:hypothetical protein n=1 Tax=Chryseobacterium daecheongense TaxID=192389 RepID=UPI001FD65761|nr:hypothetical protein [Chryseobacterium daecheongense]UOU98628.1 hypothetical protein MUU74_01355 [Chryseobacterium daecheongense]